MAHDKELAELRGKLKASRGRPGYAERVAAIEARIAKLEAKDAD
jgi:hypothetical protein